jgi:hypothetical protein
MVATSTRHNALDQFGTAVRNRKNPYEAMRKAEGLFGLRKVSLAEFSGQPANPDLHVVVRSDTGQALGCVGNNYECFPNEAFFGPVAEALVEAGAEITRFQMLDNGTRSFMRLAWPEDRNLRIGKPKVGDIVGRRATLSTSHDGKYAGKFSMQMLRLACENGMVVPVGAYDMNMFHTVGGKLQLVELAQMIPSIETYVAKFQVAADILADTRIKAGSDEAMDIISKIADPKGGAKDKSSGEPNLAKSRVLRIAELFDGQQPGADTASVKDTGWGLYNAAVDYFTHDKGTRGGDDAGRRLEQRFKSLLPGGSANKEIVRSWGIVTDGLGVTDAINAEVAAVN